MARRYGTFTPRRRAALRRAAMISAQKRRGRRRKAVVAVGALGVTLAASGAGAHTIRHKTTIGIDKNVAGQRIGPRRTPFKDSNSVLYQYSNRRHDYYITTRRRTGRSLQIMQDNPRARRRLVRGATKLNKKVAKRGYL